MNMKIFKKFFIKKNYTNKNGSHKILNVLECISIKSTPR